MCDGWFNMFYACIESYAKDIYRWANCTNPQPFPIGIFTETISPYWEKACLRSSSLAFGSSRPTNIYQKKEVNSHRVHHINTIRADLHSLLCYSNHHQTGEQHLMHSYLSIITRRRLRKITKIISFSAYQPWLDFFYQVCSSKELQCETSNRPLKYSSAQYLLTKRSSNFYFHKIKYRQD